ncbi:putative E3 ubiquitin-protein ligase ARI8 [Acorus gramineus]|uniref:RBR-type E3 ubiquitin transferase n=1 Tax=Acorus gramineus TaxID=55184 RepID=A0AAV9AJD1_ACOGR|nr:putative E3 ubiquitin-protein ligase ARI8 [Acorus gramineus]
MTNRTDYENDDDEDEHDLCVREPDHDSSGPRAQEKNYTILSESDIRARQDRDIHTLSAVLSISPEASAALLSHHNWCLTTVCDSWYLDNPAIQATCVDNDHLARSYVDNKKNIKWCPAPGGCRYAVEFVNDNNDDGPFEVTCACSHRFCWNCCEEAHRPVDCVTAAMWAAKNLDEAQNVEWWLPLNPKACPKCGVPVKKRDGCMRVACARGPWCAHEFCWLCLREWSAHGGPCNGFEERQRRRAVPRSRWMVARVTFERYAHYFERWSVHDASMAKARLDFARLGERQDVQDCGFVLDAWMVIVECRRVLKWSYVYGYYVLAHEEEEEEEGKKKKKRGLFEFLQGAAETELERLHKLVEVDLWALVEAEGRCEGFLDFHEEIVKLTRVTRSHFENLVRAVEKGLEM